MHCKGNPQYRRGAPLPRNDTIFVVFQSSEMSLLSQLALAEKLLRLLVTVTISSSAPIAIPRVKKFTMDRCWFISPITSAGPVSPSTSRSRAGACLGPLHSLHGENMSA